MRRNWFSRLRRGLPPVPRRAEGGGLRVPGEAWESREAFLAVREGEGHERLKAQWQMGVQLPVACGAEGLFGVCSLCGVRCAFGVPGQPASFDTREGLACERCRVNARMRHALGLLVDGLQPTHARLYLTEQASTGFVWVQQHFPHTVGSEFGLDESRRARMQGWFEHLGGHGALRDEDVTALHFADGSLDAIGCFDVLEHVPDYQAALVEFARVLAVGGRLVLTVPFIETVQDTLVRARLNSEGHVEHLLPPEIHGDPVAGGVLCFYHFGWDLLDACRAAGFRRAEWVRCFAPEFALYGLWTLRALR